MSGAYYNEWDNDIAAWLAEAMRAGYIAPGEIDTRDIRTLDPDDLKGFTQHHFFAGIGGWSIALRMAGWPDDKPAMTGSCPCQPFSSAGKRKGKEDDRHLWPYWFNIIKALQPATIFGEQVDQAITYGWWDDVADDLERQGYQTGAAVLPACSVGTPHRRYRLWFVADRNDGGAARRDRFVAQHDKSHPAKQTVPQIRRADADEIGGLCARRGTMGNTEHDGQLTTTQRRSEGQAVQHNAQGAHCPSQPEGAGSANDVADTKCSRQQGQRQLQQSCNTEKSGFGETDRFNDVSEIGWIRCPDGKQRPVESGLRLLVDGIPAKLRKTVLHGFGNAIVPEVAAQFIIASQGYDPDIHDIL